VSGENIAVTWPVAVSGPAGFSVIPEFPGCADILRYVVRACGYSTGEQTQQACRPESESGLRSADRFSIQVLNGSSEFSVLVEFSSEIYKVKGSFVKPSRTDVLIHPASPFRIAAGLRTSGLHRYELSAIDVNQNQTTPSEYV
jgi:hypothetical protein